MHIHMHAYMYTAECWNGWPKRWMHETGALAHNGCIAIANVPMQHWTIEMWMANNSSNNKIFCNEMITLRWNATSTTNRHPQSGPYTIETFSSIGTKHNPKQYEIFHIIFNKCLSSALFFYYFCYFLLIYCCLDFVSLFLCFSTRKRIAYDVDQFKENLDVWKNTIINTEQRA